MAAVHGSCDERFSGVRQALERNLDADELGASIAVDLDGETVVDLWGGYRDEERTTPWTQDTIVNVWSTTKTEFCANGKKNIEVRHLMSRTPGVSGWDQPFSIKDMYDWETSTERLAAQRPWWEPGTASGYHANNQGHLVGEVIRRITNKTFKWFVVDEIAGPLGADYQIGAAEKDWDRIAPVVAPPPMDIDFAALDPQSPLYRCFTGRWRRRRPASSAPTAPRLREHGVRRAGRPVPDRDTLRALSRPEVRALSVCG